VHKWQGAKKRNRPCQHKANLWRASIKS